MSERFNILMVCTGNICRSPLAQQLFSAKSIEGVQVSSAGTAALVDHAMDEQSQNIAHAQGIESPEQHRARQLTADILQDSDLIFAMTRAHRRAIVQLNPRVTKRVFTLRDFARLADATTDADLHDEIAATDNSNKARLKAAVSAALLSRSDLPLIDDDAEDIIDPYRQDASVFEESAAQLIPAVESIAGLFNRVRGE